MLNFILDLSKLKMNCTQTQIDQSIGHLASQSDTPCGQNFQACEWYHVHGFPSNAMTRLLFDWSISINDCLNWSAYLGVDQLCK